MKLAYTKILKTKKYKHNIKKYKKKINIGKLKK